MGEPSDDPLNPAELEARAAEAEAFLRSLSNRHRLMILCSLVEGEMQAGELVRRLGQSQSNVSQHLAKLREEGLLATRREGVGIHYRIASERVRPILAELHRLFCADRRTG
ncbi:metalloregulator ArsR/SmtB family transcription factor [Skermanella rosea]|uniref:ArsR/SmtB family transcription factor n=1 Tax=Skermanella rosea TaxID=1817965 RepID=UPI0019325856|nr:metalloregulator ArsR/SmtB family transcription factor [Skermanella rosea]UEM02452.1 metalloregulator ArsR/SmtB family transcription factor [Skermanella rosea]